MFFPRSSKRFPQIDTSLVMVDLEYDFYRVIYTTI